MANQTPRKLVKWAWALQTAEGTAELKAAQIALPLPAGADYGSDPHFSFPRYADGNMYEYPYIEEGTWQEGDVRVPLIPGYVQELFDWIITRDAYYQGKFATMWFDFGVVTEKYYDVKVNKAVLTIKAGAKPELVLTLQGKRVGTGEAITATVVEPWEYSFKEGAVTADWDGSTLAAENTLRTITIEIDNTLESGQEGMRIMAQDYPQTMENQLGPIVTGTLDRDFSSTALYTAMLAKATGKLVVTLTHGANVATITLPLIFYTGKRHLPIPEDGFIKEDVPFRARGSADGTDAPITMAET